MLQSNNGIGARSVGGDEIVHLSRQLGITPHTARRKLRAARAQQIVDGAPPVPQNQKARIVANLYRLGKAQSIHDLRIRLQKDGFAIDVHNLVHVIWSMQKDQIVTFRERNSAPRSFEANLTAIRLNSAGEDLAKKLLTESVAEEPTPEIEPVAPVEAAPPVVVAQVEPPISFFAEFPLIGAMLNRQARLESAAKILEEEGQPDLALATLEKIQYTPFEQEVMRLVQKEGK